MDQSQQLLALVLSATLGIVALIAILRRQRRDRTPPPESPFGVSTEGEKICASCGMGNLWTSARCVSCGGRLAG